MMSCWRGGGLERFVDRERGNEGVRGGKIEEKLGEI